MGVGHSSRKDNIDLNGEVNFDHFQILRAIGKGSFGKVCIVQKKDTGQMYAMKYMNKAACLRRDALPNVLREVEILKGLEHPFLVNLWFTFQDEEDLFVVVDLLLGGDLRYHLQRDVSFREPHVTLYICEVALALDYLRQHHILHRDIKPDNMLLDEEGHVHITDFNIATVLHPGELATSMTGTKPYMAPEVFGCALGECRGYGFPVDWWSLGVAAFELLRGRRPFDIQSGSGVAEVKAMLSETSPHLPHGLDHGLRDVVSQLLSLDPNQRITSLGQLRQHPYMQHVHFDSVLARDVKPAFLPPKDHLNCDPTYELEEMIIETRPLHKKKKRLAKQNSRKGEVTPQSSTEQELDDVQTALRRLSQDFTVYNRERLLQEKASEAEGPPSPSAAFDSTPPHISGSAPPDRDPPAVGREAAPAGKPRGKAKEGRPLPESPMVSKDPTPARPPRSPLERKSRCGSMDTPGDNSPSPPTSPSGVGTTPRAPSHVSECKSPPSPPAGGTERGSVLPPPASDSGNSVSPPRGMAPPHVRSPQGAAPCPPGIQDGSSLPPAASKLPPPPEATKSPPPI